MSNDAWEWIAIGVMWLLIGLGVGTCNWLTPQPAWFDECKQGGK